MAFNSVDYVLFLVAVFALFWRLVHLPRLRLVFLLLCSYLFYTAWNGVLVVLIIASSTLDYICGGLIDRYHPRHPARGVLLITSIGLNLGLLGFFKYANFFIDNISATLRFVGIDAASAHLDIVLPVGISFYTFQSMSYTLDIFRGKLKPARSATEFFLFVGFFPQLVAGPIVRASELLPQLAREPELSRQQLVVSFYRLFRGLVKKMVVADYLAAAIVDPTFQSPADAGALQTLLALVGFHFQVYCDFSGYTDIAIGSAGLFGLRLPENFTSPYTAHTPANYWRRWHITLSRFCFDYIYKPLGGSLLGPMRTYVNTLVTFAVIGFWHGASWSFVLFGVYHACGVIGTRALVGSMARARGVSRAAVDEELERRPIAVLLTNLFIIGSLPLFRSADLATAGIVYRQLLHWGNLGASVSAGALLVLAVAIASHFVPVAWEKQLQRHIGNAHPALQAALVLVITATVLHMASIAQRSFVYFQF